MKVLLKEDVDHLGYAGEVLEVADGYGRNFLIPRGFAVKASPSVLRQARSWRERAATRLEELRREHEALSERITATSLNFYARAGETGKLYGSVTNADVTDQLNEELGTNIDRHLVSGGPLRQLGDHSVTVKLSRDYQPQLIVHIHPFTDVEETEEQVAESQEAEVELQIDEEISSEEEALEEETTGVVDEAGVETGDVDEAEDEQEEIASEE